MRDLTPFLGEFVTYDGKCAFCAHQSNFSHWCYVKGEVVRNDDSCEKFKEKMR
jgi:hypothetical protein